MWHIPDEQDVPLMPELSTPYAIDLDAIARAAGGFNGVVSGGVVTETGTPGMGVAIASAVDVVDGVEVVVGADTLILADADATFPRWDVVVAEDDGTLTLHTGTPEQSPRPLGALPLSTVLHGRIWVPALDTAITNAQILNLQNPVPSPVGARGWTTIDATDEATAGTRNNTATLAVDSQLVFTLAASTTYRFRWHMEFDCKAASDLKVGFNGPASPVRVRAESRLRSAPVGTTTASTERSHNGYEATGFNVASTSDFIAFFDVWGTIKNGANVGAFGPWWAQNTAVAEDTVRLNASVLEYEAL